MKVTQKDIADFLNISRLTVSKALNNLDGVSRDTRIRVFQAAKKLGYSRLTEKQIFESEKVISEGGEEIGNQEKNQKQVCVLSYLKGTTDSYWAPVISGIARILAGHGMSLNLCIVNFGEDGELEMPMNFDVKTTCGIIQFGKFKQIHMEQIVAYGVPVVSIDIEVKMGDQELFVDVIMGSNLEPMAAIVEHMASYGHKRIGYAGAVEGGQLTNLERWQGYQLGMERTGLKIRKEDCFLGEIEEIIKIIEEGKRLENLQDFPTAIVCFNDMTAIGLIRHLRAKGIRVPEMIAVSGFDNLSESSVADITTANVDKEELGMCAAETLLWRITNPGRLHRMIRVSETNIIVRSSTNCPFGFMGGKNYEGKNFAGIFERKK